MRILILAAGVGSRLRPLTDLSPKPLLALGETNILERLLSQLRFTFRDIEIYVNCSYLAEAITEFISKQTLSKRPWIIWEHEPLGTAVTTLRLFKSDPSQGLLVLHGDLVLGNTAMQGILDLIKSQSESLIMVHERPLNRARSIVTVQNKKVTGIREVLSNSESFLEDMPNVLVNSGVIFLAPHSLSNIEMPNLGTEISPYLIQKLSRAGNLGFELWKWDRVAVDSLPSYEQAVRMAAADPSSRNQM